MLLSIGKFKNKSFGNKTNIICIMYYMIALIINNKNTTN